MPTYWVDPDAGNDGNAGTSFGAAKATLAGAVAVATKGDVINLTNGANNDTPLMAASDTIDQTVFTGSNFTSDIGLTIQGTDSSGSARLCEIRYADDASTETFITFSPNVSTDPKYIILQGLYVNWQANTAASATKHFITRTSGIATNSAGPVWLRYSHFAMAENIFGYIMADHSASITTSGNWGTLSHCYIDDRAGSGGTAYHMSVHHRGQGTMHHNVWRMSGAYAHGRIGMSCGSNDSLVTDHRFYNNTIIVDGDIGIQALWWSGDTGSSGGNATKHLHSNVIYSEQTAANTLQVADGNVAGSSATYTRVMGYNLFSFTDTPGLRTGGRYERPWDPDDDDTGSPETQDYWATDVVTASNVFKDDATSYSWDFEGSSYSVTLPGDYRILDTSTWRTMAQDSGVPGAIAAAPTTPDIDGSDITIYANTTDGNTGDVTINNVGDGTLNITNVVLAGDAEFTYTDVTTAAIAASGSDTFTVNFLPTAYPGTYTATLTFTSDDPDEGTFVINITGIAESVPDPIVPGGDPIAPVSPDSPAFYGTDPPNTSGLVTRVQVYKNTEFETKLKAVGSSGSVTHVAYGHIILATNLTLTPVVLPTTGYSVVMVESDIPVAVQVNSFTFSLEGCFALGGSSLTTFKLGNPSTIREANVIFYGSK